MLLFKPVRWFWKSFFQRAKEGRGEGRGEETGGFFQLFFIERMADERRKRRWKKKNVADSRWFLGWMIRPQMGFQDERKLEWNVWAGGGGERGVSPLFLRRSGIFQLGLLQFFWYVRCGILLLRKFCFSGYGTGDGLVCNRWLLSRVVGSISSGWLRFLSLRF